MLTVFLIFIVLLAFIFLGFPIFMSLLITGILFLTLGGNSLGLTVIKMFGQRQQPFAAGHPILCHRRATSL